MPTARLAKDDAEVPGEFTGAACSASRFAMPGCQDARGRPTCSKRVTRQLTTGHPNS